MSGPATGASSTGSRPRSGGPFRVGFIGTGFIADWHARALQNIKAADLAAVCDVHPGRRDELADRYGVTHRHADWNSLLKSGEIDAVHILLPPQMHDQAIRDALENDVHVLVEKPVTVRSDQIDPLVALAEDRGLGFAVSHNFGFDPCYESLRADLRSGILGRPDIITITWNRELPQILHGSSVGWLFAEPINILLEVGPHSIAHMIDLMGGPPRSLTARADNPKAMPNGRDCYRRWTVDADYGATLVRLVFSFVPGFTEHTVHVRGSLASATADLENWHYDLQQHSRYQDDVDRFWMLRRRSRTLWRQAKQNLGRYFAGKFGISQRGNQYGYSIQRAIDAFYRGIGGSLDERLTAQTGQAVIRVCEEIAGSADLPKQNATAPISVSPARTDTADALVIGGTGFIGRELVAQLVEAGRAVRVLARDPRRFAGHPGWQNVDIRQGDMADRESLRDAMHGAGTVYHLARAYGNTWDDFARHDIPGTQTIAELCLETGVRRLVYSGTIDSYYAGRRGDVITEQVPLDPKIHLRKPYARAKAASEDLLLEMHRSQGLPLVIVRPGIVIGSGGDPFHWGVGMFTHGAVANLWGRGEHPLPIVLVQDVAAALVAIEQTAEIDGEVFNLIGEPVLSAREYVAELEKAAGIRLQVRPTAMVRYYLGDLVKYAAKVLVRHPGRFRPSYRDWQGRTQNARFDCSKAKRILGWTPASDREELIDKGIRQPVAEFLF